MQENVFDIEDIMLQLYAYFEGENHCGTALKQGYFKTRKQRCLICFCLQEIALQFNQYSKGNPHLPSAQVYKTIRVELMGDTINKR